MTPSIPPSDQPKKKFPMVYAIIGLIAFCSLISFLIDPPGRQTLQTSPSAVAEASVAPTATIAPTVEPSPTIEPTATIEPTQEPTVEPTVEPTPAPPVVGIGVSRAAVQEVYEREAVGFTFEDSSPVDGQPRVNGKSRNGLAILELIGPEEELTKATIIVGVPTDNQQAVTENAVYMLGLLKVTSPEWTASTDWVTENLGKIANSDEPVTTVQGDQQISLTNYKSLGFVSLAVEAAP